MITVFTQPKPFALLNPTVTPARTGPAFAQLVTPADYDALLADLTEYGNGLVALDFETRGTEPWLPDNYIVGMGLAWEHGSIYADRQVDPSAFDSLLAKLLDLPLRLIAHNAYYDFMWTRYQFNKYSFYMCTYALYRHLSSEGWIGQKWGLKDAMQDVLLWSDTNESGIDNWLIENGWKNQSGNPRKDQMWRVPAEILGHYCILDAEATYLLYTKHLGPTLQQFPALQEYMEGPFNKHIRIHIDQKLHGMTVNMPRLQSAIDKLTGDMAEIDKKIFALAKEHIEYFESEKLREFMCTEPVKYLKKKERTEPIKFRKDGSISKNWLKWNALEEADRLTGPVLSKNWLKWDERRKAVESGQDKSYRFNFQSDDNVRWLLFNRMGYEPTEFTDSEDNPLPSVSTENITHCGEIGKLIGERAGIEKELGYLTDYMERAQLTGGTIHPGFRIPGTLTGRLGGTNPNVAQMPKTKLTMSCFTGRPGTVLVDLDFAALEPHVGAELSGDRDLMALYGPGSKPTDVYLHYGSHPAMPPDIRLPIVKAGFDRDNPTKEAVTVAKAQCKSIRSLMKAMYLSDTYGSGVGKKHQILQKQGFDVSLKQVEAIHEALQSAKSGVLQYTEQLRREWTNNSRHGRAVGWFYSGLGHPIGVHQKKLKDLWNSQCQNTGHSVLVLWLDILADLLDQSGIQWKPYIWDWHDAATIEVPEHQANEAARLMELAVQLINEKLGGVVKLKGTAAIGRTLADCKEPES